MTRYILAAITGAVTGSLLAWRKHRKPDPGSCPVCDRPWRQW